MNMASMIFYMIRYIRTFVAEVDKLILVSKTFDIFCNLLYLRLCVNVHKRVLACCLQLPLISLSAPLETGGSRTHDDLHGLLSCF